MARNGDRRTMNSLALDRRLERLAGWSLVVGGVLFWAFYGSSAAGFGLGDDQWLLSLSLHAITILAIMAGLIVGRSALALDGWASATWWIATALAFLGLTIANVFFSLGVMCLAAVAFGRLRHAWTAALLSVGGGLWLYLYAAGVRVGDENARALTDAEELTGLVATTAIALGLIALGLAVNRQGVGHEVTIEFREAG